MASSKFVNGVNLSAIDDENKLQDMLDSVSDFDDRKLIRERIKEIKDLQRAQRSQLLNRLENAREDTIQKKMREAAEERRQTLLRFDSMAKEASVGKKMGDFKPTAQVQPANTFTKMTVTSTTTSSTRNEPHQQSATAPKVDYMQEIIEERKKAATERSQRVLSSLETMAKTPRDMPATRPASEIVKKNLFAQFEIMSGGGAAKGSAPAFKSAAPTKKDMIIEWVKSRTKNYNNVNVTNLSSSWANGLAFCALVHSFFPDAFNYNELEPSNRRHNFELAFTTAEKLAGVCQLLEVNDMIAMGDKPDYKCVFTYLTEMYRGLKKFE